MNGNTKIFLADSSHQSTTITARLLSEGLTEANKKLEHATQELAHIKEQLQDHILLRKMTEVRAGKAETYYGLMMRAYGCMGLLISKCGTAPGYEEVRRLIKAEIDLVEAVEDEP